MNNEINRDIVALSDYEHVLIRPEMYVGSVTPNEEKLPTIENDKLIQRTKIYSVGMYKLFDEVLDNALDECKRCVHEGYRNLKIKINLNTQTNKVIIIAIIIIK